MTNEEVIKNLENDVRRYSKKEFDGVTTTFQLPAVWNIVTVSLSSFPNILRKGVDFTYTPTSITFTSEINPATSLAFGQTCVLTVVTG